MKPIRTSQKALAPAAALLFVLTGVARLAGQEAAETPNTLSDAEKADGFRLLFDGVSLDEGWSQKGNWEVRDGAIARVKGGGSLVWETEPVPDDFELRFEWKISEGGNSGVYYRPGQYEYQILDNAKHSDGTNPRTSAASLYFAVAPSKDATQPVGEWNKARVVCKGTVIQHWLNGEKVVDFDYTDERWKADLERFKNRGGDVAARGAKLSFQDHGDPVFYRSIRLRALPADADIAHATVEPAPVPAEALTKEAAILDRIRKNREAREKAVKGK